MTESKYLSRLTPEFLEEHWPGLKCEPPFFRVPIGYKQKGGDPQSLVPYLEVIELLEQALDAIDDGTSVRNAVGWFNAQLEAINHKTISFMWMDKLWHKHRGVPGNPRFEKLMEAKNKIKAEPVIRKKRRSINQKIGQQSRKITNQKRRMEELLQKAEELDVKKKTLEAAKNKLHETYLVDVPEGTDEQDIAFQPHPGPQAAFLASSEQEVLYGGAAGGGKSYALVADPMRYFDSPYFNGIILRRTNDELREVIRTSQLIYPKVFPKAEWSESKKTWKLPAGGHMWFTYIEHDNDAMRYQGQQFNYVGFDELTQHPTPYLWNFMRTRLRAPEHANLPLIMRATTNPGGPGHGWVKKMFIDPAPPNKAFVARDEDGKELRWTRGEREGKPLFYRRFIPASLYDNPSLANDGQYEANLLAQPEHVRRQLLEGDWNIVAGAAFSEWDQKRHVIEPFKIPADWRRFRSCDFGYASYSAVHWFAIEPSTDRLFCYRELYISKHTGSELADRILELEKDDSISYGVLDSSCWAVRGINGVTVAEEMIKKGVRWKPSDRTNGARVAGRNRFHEYLKDDQFDGRPRLQFFNTCRQIITDLPMIPTDPNGTDDIDPDYKSDHAYDSVRYALLSRPKGLDPWFETRGQPLYDYNPADNVFGY